MNNSETKYIDKLKSWAETVEMHPLPDWDELPELELYMDQVIILTGRYLGYMEPLTGEDKPVTPAMINNYVKMGLMPPPVKKKYSRCQLACIIIICILKRSLTMSAIQKILNKDVAPADIEILVTDQLRTRKDKNIAEDEADGESYVVRLAVIADFCRFSAEKLAGELNIDDNNDLKGDDE